ncbi:hypothetical protein [Helicobacter didelphidarum]|nr:hypothetical protein [Helicobacter didelphidarum]
MKHVSKENLVFLVKLKQILPKIHKSLEEIPYFEMSLQPLNRIL